MRVIYPGSFDPPTKGHIDIARRAGRLFGDLVVLVLENPKKRQTLSVSQRAALLEKCLKDAPGVRVEWGTGLLTDEVKRLNAQAVLRGIRSETDYQAERPVADAFLDIFGTETLFMQCNPALGYVSSSLARELLILGGDADRLLPDEISDEIRAAYRPTENGKG